MLSLVVDAGTALLDRLAWVARGMLEGRVAELHPARHAVAAAQIRELIGN
jgi:HAMP domain-containing protein